MYKKFVLFVLVGMAVQASAQSLVKKETHFLGIPNVDSLSADWYVNITDSTDYGFHRPSDVEVLRLSASDYRFVVLDAYGPPFIEFRIDQQNGIADSTIVHSGDLPDSTCFNAVAMCQVKSGEYFNPPTDRVAVVFQDEAQIAVYQLNSASGEFTLERSFTNPDILRPTGIYSAFGQFFVVDDSAKAIIRTDSLGNTLSSYGHPGTFDDGYDRMSDISGYQDFANTAHLFIGDGANERLDHLIATSSGTAISLQKQALAQEYDTLGMHLPEVAYLQGAGVIGFDRFLQRFFLWRNPDSLTNISRSEELYQYDEEMLIHVKSACGRLITISRYPEGLALWSYVVQDATLDNPLPPPYGHWTTNMSPVTVSDSLHITSGNELIIDPGVEVHFNGLAALVVEAGGKLTVNGTEAEHVIFKAVPGNTWNGVYDNGGRLNLSYVQFQDVKYNSIYTSAPAGCDTPVVISHCTIDGSNMLAGYVALKLFNSPSLLQRVDSTVVENVTSNSYGMYLFHCKVDFKNDTIRNCSYINSYIKQTSGNFRNCDFSGRASLYPAVFYSATCNPNFQCCTFTNLAPSSGSYQATIFCTSGTSPSFGYELSPTQEGVSNVISDSSSYLLSMDGYPVLPIVDNPTQGSGPGGRNDWHQKLSKGKFFNWNISISATYKCENQFWDPAATISMFNPAVPAYWDYSPPATSAWLICGGSSGQGGGQSFKPTDGTRDRGARTGLDDVDFEALYSQAIQLEDSGAYADANSLFHQVAASTPDSTLRWYAATHVVTSAIFLPHDNGWIAALIDSLIGAQDSSYNSYFYGHRLLTCHLVNREEYSDAMNVCTALLNHGLEYRDSIYAAIDLISVQQAAGWVGVSGGELDAAGHGIPSTLRVSGDQQGLALERDLLNALGADGSENRETSVVPTSYQLYQNYPNPFNPNTEIRFDLPENTMVKLRIYNTLGQLVTTLVDGVRDAGAYHLQWNGKNANGVDLASGVYIYRLEAGKFVSSRKMVLLK